ncbi:MAG: tRNA dihydrouridine synthase DusB [Acidobacteriota bacterium]
MGRRFILHPSRGTARPLTVRKRQVPGAFLRPWGRRQVARPLLDCLNWVPVEGLSGPSPQFFIGATPVYGDLVLAPMSGYSDLPFRSLCRRFGSALSYTEFVSAKEIVRGAGLHWKRALTFLPWERPVIIQIFDGDENRLVEAGLRVAELEPDVIDVNMGCSVPKIAGRGAGAALLKEPAKIARIFDRLTKAVALPVTGKIRLGWDQNTRNYLEILAAMQDHGAAMVAVHARTREQGYSGQADWDAIAEIVQAARIPVLGNGDVQSVRDAEKMKETTGCAAVMVGRGAIGNPWLFQRRERGAVPLSEKIRTVRYHFQLMEDYYGQPLASILMRKHLTKYFNEHPGVRGYRPRLVKIESKEELNDLLELIGQLVA